MEHLISTTRRVLIGSVFFGAILFPHGQLKAVDSAALKALFGARRVLGLQHLRGWREGKRLLMAERLDAMHAAFAAHAPMFQVVSAGAFFAYLRHPFTGRSAREVAVELAQQTGVLTLPGSMFGPQQEDYLRLAFANVDASLMDEAARRLAAYARRNTAMMVAAG